jgi:hypothetical protein
MALSTRLMPRKACDGGFCDIVGGLTRKFASLWWEDDSRSPHLGRAYDPREQSLREKSLQRFLDELAAELGRIPRDQSERESVQERILGAFAAFARGALGFEERHLDFLFSSGFTRTGPEFARWAGRFDPGVSGSSVFQAMRNAWAMNGLQALLGLPVELTPAVFAYSMLYPYTDNYLDDPAISRDEKVAFNNRLASRLSGESTAPRNEHEGKVYELVGMIEGQYPRSEYPQVFESLLAIHRAQEKSVLLLRSDAAPYEIDVLDISLEKGGTSVLADGYLVAGSLSQSQTEFMFGYGAFLQLGDDLQDVNCDRGDGLLTIFSQTAGRWPLDGLTDRTFHFGSRVLDRLNAFDTPGIEPLKELIRISGLSLVRNAAGRARRLYSKDYVRLLEAHSPMRFRALDRSRRRMGKQQVSMMQMVEAFALPKTG